MIIDTEKAEQKKLELERNILQTIQQEVAKFSEETNLDIDQIYVKIRKDCVWGAKRITYTVSDVTCEIEFPI